MTNNLIRIKTDFKVFVGTLLRVFCQKHLRAGRHIYSSKMSSGVILGRLILRPLGSLGGLGCRGISGKALRDPNYKRPTPWPYKEKGFNFFHAFLLRESTTARMDENSKIIVVDGPIASGSLCLCGSSIIKLIN